MAIKSAATEWRQVVLVCRKCSKKLDGGFGPDGDLTLKKALRRFLRLPKGKKGRRHELAVVGADCFGLCPKRAVVAVNTASPDQLLVVPSGADLLEVKARLGLSDTSLDRPLRVVAEGS